MHRKENIAEDEWTLPEIVRRQYRHVSDEAIQALENACRVWECNKGDCIVEQDQKCDRYIFIAKGLHRVMFSNGNKTDTLFFDGGGSIFTSFHTLCADKNCVFRVEALSKTYGWEISHRRYRMLQDKYPDLVRFEVGLLRMQLYSLEDYYKRRALSTPQERYEKFWGKRQEKLSYLSPHILSKFVPLKVIAQYLSMTPQMLSILRRREIDNNKRKR